ncbi:MAG: glycosyltransferase [Thermoleophilia bacterium]
MRVLHVNKRYPPHVGGIEKHLQDLARSQARVPGVEVDVVAVAEGPSARETDHGVEVYRARQLGTFASNPVSPDILHVLKESYHDVWHFHYPFPTGELSLLLSGRRSGPRPVTVCTYHSDSVPQTPVKRVLAAPYERLTRRFLERMDGIIAGSPGMAVGSPFLAGLGDTVRVIPYGIDPAPWRSSPDVARAAAGLRTRYGTPLTLFVGRLVPYKGADVLLEAFRHAPGSLVLVGAGPLRTFLEETAVSLGLAHRVHFAGSIGSSELVEHFHAADVFALPSVTPNEAFGLVQLEAHACGVPVVSTDLPTGVPFANKHGVSGIVVRRGDPIELAAALRLLLGDEMLRRRLGSQARERQRREFSLETMTRSVLEYYQELLSARGGEGVG